MKKKIFYIIVCMILACNTTAMAQEIEYPKHEIAVGYGVGGMTDIANFIAEVFTDIYDQEIEKKNHTGEISLQYLYNINKTIGIGLEGIYSGVSGRSKEGNVKQNTDYIIVMPTLRAHWFRKADFSIYSRVAAGAYFSMDSATKTEDGKTEKKSNNDGGFAFQVCPVGLEIGSKNFSGFLEGGVGFQGFIVAGLRIGI